MDEVRYKCTEDTLEMMRSPLCAQMPAALQVHKVSHISHLGLNMDSPVNQLCETI